MVTAMLSPEWATLPADMAGRKTLWLGFVALLAMIWSCPNTFDMAKDQGRWQWKPNALWLTVGVSSMVIGSCVMLYGVNRVNEFLYFNF